MEATKNNTIITIGIPVWYGADTDKLNSLLDSIGIALYKKSQDEQMKDKKLQFIIGIDACDCENKNECSHAENLQKIRNVIEDFNKNVLINYNNAIDLSLFESTNNLKVSVMRNIMIDEAKSEFITFFDDDDAITKNAFLTFLYALENDKIKEMNFINFKYLKHIEYNKDEERSEPQYGYGMPWSLLMKIEKMRLENTAFIPDITYEDKFLWMILKHKKFFEDSSDRLEKIINLLKCKKYQKSPVYIYYNSSHSGEKTSKVKVFNSVVDTYLSHKLKDFEIIEFLDDNLHEKLFYNEDCKQNNNLHNLVPRLEIAAISKEDSDLIFNFFKNKDKYFAKYLEAMRHKNSFVNNYSSFITTVFVEFLLYNINVLKPILEQLINNSFKKLPEYLKISLPNLPNIDDIIKKIPESIEEQFACLKAIAKSVKSIEDSKIEFTGKTVSKNDLEKYFSLTADFIDKKNIETLLTIYMNTFYVDLFDNNPKIQDLNFLDFLYKSLIISHIADFIKHSYDTKDNENFLKNKNDEYVKYINDFIKSFNIENNIELIKDFFRYIEVHCCNTNLKNDCNTNLKNDIEFIMTILSNGRVETFINAFFGQEQEKNKISENKKNNFNSIIQVKIENSIKFYFKGTLTESSLDVVVENFLKSKNYSTDHIKIYEIFDSDFIDSFNSIIEKCPRSESSIVKEILPYYFLAYCYNRNIGNFNDNFKNDLVELKSIEFSNEKINEISPKTFGIFETEIVKLIKNKMEYCETAKTSVHSRTYISTAFSNNLSNHYNDDAKINWYKWLSTRTNETEKKAKDL